MTDIIKIEDLKIGEFYDLYSESGYEACNNPAELLKITAKKFIFIDREENVYCWYKCIHIDSGITVKKHKKHKKPPEFPKKTMMGWVGFNDSKASLNHPFDMFFNKDACNLLFDTKAEALEIRKKAEYIKVTIELADPEEKQNGLK